MLLIKPATNTKREMIMDKKAKKMRLRLIAIRQMEYYEAWEEDYKTNRSHVEQWPLTSDEAREVLLAILKNKQIRAPL